MLSSPSFYITIKDIAERAAPRRKRVISARFSAHARRILRRHDAYDAYCSRANARKQLLSAKILLSQHESGRIRRPARRGYFLFYRRDNEPKLLSASITLRFTGQFSVFYIRQELRL